MVDVDETEYLVEPYVVPTRRHVRSHFDYKGWRFATPSIVQGSVLLRGDLDTWQATDRLAANNTVEHFQMPDSDMLYALRSVVWHTHEAFVGKHFFRRRMQDFVDSLVQAKQPGTRYMGRIR